MIRLSELRAWPFRLLAFARSAEPRPILSGTALGLDALLAGLAATAWLMIDDRHPWSAGLAAPTAVLVSTLPLALRRVYPVSVFWIVLFGIVIANNDANFVSFVAVMLAAYSAIVQSRFRGWAVLSVPARRRLPMSPGTRRW